MRRTLLATAALCSMSTTALADGFLPDCTTEYKLPTKSVAWMTMPSETGTAGHLLGGTVWFIGRQQVVAVLHEHASVLADWTMITLRTGNVVGFEPTATKETLARISHEIDTGAPEKLYIIELAETFGDIEVPRIRFGAPADNEPVFSLTYQDEVFQLVTGRHVLPKQSTNPDEGAGPPPPFLMFELADPEEKNRLVIDFGSSGSPIFDCTEQVVASVAMIVTQDLELGVTTLRTSTAWGQPNVFGTPTGAIVPP